MNGIIDGEIVMNAGIYQKSVCEVCLNCEHDACINPSHGCDRFREAMKKSDKRGYGKRRQWQDAEKAGVW